MAARAVRCVQAVSMRRELSKEKPIDTRTDAAAARKPHLTEYILSDFKGEQAVVGKRQR
jgi:hypothetical protein